MPPPNRNPFRITVLISGGGTTLKNLIQWQSTQRLDAEIVQVISNQPKAPGLEFARKQSIPTTVINHKEFDSVDAFSDAIFKSINSAQTDLVVMGGFLRRVKIPPAFGNRVVNIHPSLIPAFCGQGHYGRRVHQAVLDYGCKISGCTVHFVDDEYDHGPIIAQQTVPVLDDDTADILAQRVFAKECEIYPQMINAIAQGKVQIANRRVTMTR